MIPWRELDRASIPGEDSPLTLVQRGDEFALRLGHRLLMSSRARGSEEALARLACERVAARRAARVLIGGLGMGFTLAAALAWLGADARVTVAELLPAVVAWNRGPLAALAGAPLADPRVSVHEGDVAQTLRASAAYDAILLDVDNGPDGLTRSANDRLYSPAGLRSAHAALRAGGVLAVWSVAPDRAFTRRLERAGFRAEEHRVRARVTKGGWHTLWIATRDRGAAG